MATVRQVERVKLKNLWMIDLEEAEILKITKEYAVVSNRLKKSAVPKIAETLREKIEEAFNDMTTIYAPELTGGGKDKLAGKIQKHGKGTLGYISDKRNEAIQNYEELLSHIYNY